MSNFASSSTIKTFSEDELNVAMAGTFSGAPLTPISGYDSDDEFSSQSSLISGGETHVFGSELVDSADGWECCKCGYITSQEHTTCRKCDHGCCRNCKD